MSVRAKFHCNKIERTLTTVYEDGKPILKEVQTIKLFPVSSGSDENKKFFALTPSGEVSLGTVNADAAAQFQLGKEYYVDFTPA